MSSLDQSHWCSVYKFVVRQRRTKRLLLKVSTVCGCVFCSCLAKFQRTLIFFSGVEQIRYHQSSDSARQASLLLTSCCPLPNKYNVTMHCHSVIVSQEECFLIKRHVLTEVLLLVKAQVKDAVKRQQPQCCPLATVVVQLNECYCYCSFDGHLSWMRKYGCLKIFLPLFREDSPPVAVWLLFEPLKYNDSDIMVQKNYIIYLYLYYCFMCYIYCLINGARCFDMLLILQAHNRVSSLESSMIVCRQNKVIH